MAVSAWSLMSVNMFRGPIALENAGEWVDESSRSVAAPAVMGEATSGDSGVELGHTLGGRGDWSAVSRLLASKGSRCENHIMEERKGLWGWRGE